MQKVVLRDVEEVENFWIVLADGQRLAARAWMPQDAAANPVPAVLEYLPYRKRDGTAPRDETMHPFVAARGYACVRVDIRGSGDSDGLMLDEYLPQELNDGVEIIDWIARQPWCSGDVGMLGISWGGFNGLQIAVLKPPALKAVVTICSTDDRYADDIHYRGGALLNDNHAWSAQMMAFLSRPPDPALVGDAWRAIWMQRLEKMPFLAANWLEHQRRDMYWRHGSVCENFDDIGIPVLAVGGWADAYTNAIPRLLVGLKGRAMGLIGPWGHKYPHLGVPGPAIDFRQEMVDWWDRWLSNRADKQELPALRVYMLEGADQTVGEDARAGFWLSEHAWPSPDVVRERLYLTSHGGLDANECVIKDASVCSPLTTGLSSGQFYPKLGRPDLPMDQRCDDAGSLLFDGAPLEAPLDLLGAPQVELDLSVDRPQANLAVRLCHVTPDGASHRISLGMLNLTHRDSHVQPQPLEPGRRYRVRVQLDDIGYRVPVGHRLRVAVSTAYWPMIWPSPKPVTLRLYSGLLDVPVRSSQNRQQPTLPEREPVALGGFTILSKGRTERRVHHDLMTSQTVVERLDDGGLKRLSHGLETGICVREIYTIRSGDPLSASARCEWSTQVGRGEWRTRSEGWSLMRADAEHFYLEAEVVAFENDKEVHRYRWERAIPRDLV